MATDSIAAVVSGSKFVAEPKATYPLSIEDLSDIAAYSPDERAPDSLHSRISIPAGSVFAQITTATPVPRKRWSTVQVSKDKHIELNSALVYLNHSCRPSLEIDVDMMEVRVAKERDLKAGDELTFFYPSTEWQMDKPFECLCGADNDCLRTISGAADIDGVRLGKWFVNEHISKMKIAQASKGLTSNKQQANV